MVGVLQIILLVVGMHVLALACAGVLIVHAMRADPTVSWRSPGGESDDGWGNDRRRPRRPPRGPDGGLPLPDAEPARVRLRDHRRLGDQVRHRERRPAREPIPSPAREPARQ